VQACGCIPLNFILLEDFPLAVVADDFVVHEAAQIELLRTKEGGHGRGLMLSSLARAGEIQTKQ
jgi:hypothetical protein